MNRRMLSQWAVLGSALLFAAAAQAQVMDVTHAFTPCSLNGTYTQDFNGSDFAATTTVPAGWTYRERGTNINTIDGLFTDSPGQSNTSNTRRFRFDQTPDEAAFGTQRSASDSPDTAEQWIGMGLTNGCPGVVTALSVQYTGETWRVAVANRTDGLLFEYSLDATALDNGTWVSVHALDYFNPGGAITNGSLGNVTSAVVAGSVSGLFLYPGATMMIRWSDYDTPVVGREDGIGIDDLTITPTVLHMGDANADDTVNLADFSLLKAHFNETGSPAWGCGNFNGDDKVDLADFSLLKAHFNHATGDNPLQAAPEPATSTLLAIAGAALLRRRPPRRRKIA